MANEAAQSSSAIATYRVLRELGKRSQRAYAAVRGDGSLVVLHRFTRSAADLDGELVSAEEMALLLRDARCIEKNWHPNVARVRHVDLAGDVLHVASDLVDGVTLDELLALARARRAHPEEPALSHAVLARVFLDVLAGLHALHSLRDGINAPIDARHGELCPANVVVGRDGVARVVNVLRPRRARVPTASEGLCYASPEALAGEAGQDARADVHAVGVMLWEALSERRLYDERDPARVAQRQREEEVAPPNARLAEVATRALSFDPALRFRTAQDMAASVRALAGTVAAGSSVAQIVGDLAGDRIRARRAELDPRSSGPQRRSSPTLVTMPAQEVRVLAPTSPDVESDGDARRTTPDDDDDLPGPRESTPDDDYLAQLSTALQAPAEETGAEEGAPSFPEAPARAAPDRDAARPAPPHDLGSRAPAAPDAAAPRREPSTRTPFVVDLQSGALAPSSPDLVDFRAGQLSRPALAAAAALLVVLAGGAALLRSSPTPEPATAVEALPAPDARVTAPTPADEPTPSETANANTAAPPRRDAATPPPNASASASAPAAPRVPPRKRSVYDPTRYR